MNRISKTITLLIFCTQRSECNFSLQIDIFSRICTFMNFQKKKKSFAFFHYNSLEKESLHTMWIFSEFIKVKSNSKSFTLNILWIINSSRLQKIKVL